MRYVGLDFGTTNSALSVVEEGAPRLARFRAEAGFTDTFRSVLFVPQDVWMHRGRGPLGGPRAIETFVSEGGGRLVQSLKSYLADRTFERTNLFGRTQTLVEMLGMLLRCLRAEAEEDLGPLGSRLVVGRPVRFWGADTPEDEAFALGRLREALALAGWDDVRFEPEPVAAAYYYERSLARDELLLVGDFGGGTSDFTVARVGPRARSLGASRILANDGVALAGDAFDGRLVERVVAPALGSESTYVSVFGRTVDVPSWPYERLRRWHHVAFLKEPRILRMLAELEPSSSDPLALAAFREVIESDLGYALYRAVERTKRELSAETFARLRFELGTKDLEHRVARADLEGWIARELAAIEASIERVLERAGVEPSQIDRVFLTGGSSFVPAVRALFAARFGEAKLQSGGELVSVATGLSLLAAEGRA